jgi:hypothetical protein
MQLGGNPRNSRMTGKDRRNANATIICPIQEYSADGSNENVIMKAT